MNTTLATDQLMALMESDSFQVQLKEAGEREAVQKILANNGVEMTSEEIYVIIEYTEKTGVRQKW